MVKTQQYILAFNRFVMLQSLAQVTIRANQCLQLHWQASIAVKKNTIWKRGKRRDAKVDRTSNYPNHCERRFVPCSASAHVWPNSEKAFNGDSSERQQHGSPPFQELTQSAPRRFALLVKPHIVRAKQTKAFNGALIMVNTNIYN